MNPSGPADVSDQKAIDDSAAKAGSSQAEKDSVAAVSDYSKETTDSNSMKVRVYSPYVDYYDGEAFSLTAENATGPFDILPKHHNFIALLQPCDVIVRTVSQGEKRIHIGGGLLHVKSDEVMVFLDV
jgi:ATP synthase, Delta/Epsilon chain, beta-sandwich domain